MNDKRQMLETTENLLRGSGYNGEMTLAEAAKWLRYEKGISVEPVSTTTKGKERTYRVYVNSNITIEDSDSDTYEQALEYGIIKGVEMLSEQQRLINDMDDDVL